MVDQTSQFYAILTNIGAAKQANADALGIPWTFAHMGVGDGNPGGLENPPLPMPTASQTALLNEWRRAPLNQLKVDPNNAAVIIAEQIIPADVGGKWIREISLYDADGDLVAVANCPPTFKPLLSQGSGRTQVVRVNLIVSSSSNVLLKIDPSVVLATREWVTEELAKQDFKHSVVAATTAAITLSGLQTVDGVVLTAGVRVLVKNQAAAKDNGLYLVVAGGAWTRCPDADISAKVTPGMLVLVERGTVNAESAWQLVTDAPITLGVTALTYEMAFGRTGVAAGTYRSVTVDAYGRVTAATNPSTVAGYGLTDVYTKTQIDQALGLKASLASPIFTGDPRAPTAGQFDADGSLATTEFVQRALGSFRGYGTIGSNRSVALGDIGCVLRANGVWTLTLPTPSSIGLTPGAAFTIYGSGNNATVVPGAGVTLSWDANTIASHVVKYAQSATFMAISASDWIIVNSTAEPWKNLGFAESGFSTADKFDASGKLATTEFIRTAGLSYGGYSSVGTKTIAAADIGKILFPAAGSTLTLPNPTTAGFPQGSAFTVFTSNAASAITVAAAAGVQIALNGYVSSVSLLAGQAATFVALGSNWVMLGHGAGMGASADMAALLSANGYKKDPSGLLIQWGALSVASLAAGQTADYVATFPIAFPTSCFSFSATANSNALMLTANRATNQLTVTARNVGATAAAGSGFWMAIGC
ncbi:phage tail protein [Pseudomonas sp.]|uniref:phage tail protein n=1 Tax=Pseudomonas sp. TaxID=306 RepID=UPI003C7117C1